MYYRQADSLSLNRKNFEMWLQGAYFYEALCCVSPILHAFAKGGTKPNDYSTHPYRLDQETPYEKEMREEREAKEFVAHLEKMFGCKIQ